MSGLPFVVVLTRLAIDPATDSDLRQLSAGEEERFLSEDWIVSRLNLLQCLAVPSLTGQSQPPDLHLVAIDARVREMVRGILSDNLPRFSELIEVPPGGRFNDCVRERIRGVSNDVLSIRLDSDDCLSRNFIQLLLKKSSVGQATNFPHGVQWNFSERFLFHRFIRSNPTVAYRSQDDRHVFDFGRHRAVQRAVPTKNVWTLRPMYLKFSHSLAHASFQSGGLPVLGTRKALANFRVGKFEAGELPRRSIRPLFAWLVFTFQRRFKRLDSLVYPFFSQIRENFFRR